MFVRDPTQLFERYGRQLLVQGVDFDGQQRLHRLAAVFGSDRSAVAQHAALAAARYLVGAGLGRAAIARGGALLQALDPQLELLDGPLQAHAPAAHLWFAQRPYGASVEIALQDQPGAERVAVLQWRLGAPALAAEAVALGAAAADLLLADQLGVEALPTAVTIDWSDPLAPQTRKRPAEPPASLAASTPLAVAGLRADPALLSAIAAEAERCYPAEACGLLVREPTGELCVVAAENLQDRWHAADPEAFVRSSRSAFSLDEREIAREILMGRALVAIWHSHCDAGTHFSAEDRRAAAPDGQPLYPEVLHLVVSVRGGQAQQWQVHAWDGEVLRSSAVQALLTAA